MASGTGKTAGRGMKGQKSRSGVSLLGFEGGQMPLYRRLPKRGFHNPFRVEYAEVNTGALQQAVDAGRLDAKKPVTIDALAAAGLFSNPRGGVKLLAKGELKTKLTIDVTRASKAAIAVVEKAGGSVTLAPVKVAPEGKKAEKKAARESARMEKVAKAGKDGGAKQADKKTEAKTAEPESTSEDDA